MVDVWDPSSGELVLSERLDFYALGFIAAQRVVAYGTSETGVPEVRLYDLSFVNP